MKKGSIPFLAHCPHCLLPYDRADARLVDHYPEGTMFHVSCRSCQASILFALTKKTNEYRYVGMRTDCSFEDALRFKTADSITEEDVFAVRQALELDNFIEIR